MGSFYENKYDSLTIPSASPTIPEEFQGIVADSKHLLDAAYETGQGNVQQIKTGSAYLRFHDTNKESGANWHAYGGEPLLAVHIFDNYTPPQRKPDDRELTDEEKAFDERNKLPALIISLHDPSYKTLEETYEESLQSLSIGGNSIVLHGSNRVRNHLTRTAFKLEGYLVVLDAEHEKARQMEFDRFIERFHAKIATVGLDKVIHPEESEGELSQAA